ncbi:MAG TPA: hypothetical protein PKJ27_08260, partial [Bacteroidales bacterium]|nr:hypothetical protein [Bacteroidales bacterium]
DSNLRPSGPKPDALTGLRYTPITISNILTDLNNLPFLPDAQCQFQTMAQKYHLFLISHHTP